MIPYGKQSIDQSDLVAVEAALLSEYLTQGPRVKEFERDLERYTGAKHAVAVNSATSALHLAYLALGVGPGDEVWTTAISFVATANAALYCGASVDFVDIEPQSFNICPLTLRSKLESAVASGAKLPKVVVPVHMAGQPANMQAIGELSKEFGFRVVEDASHALGSEYLDKRTGSCEFSDVAVFSFHPVKMITTGEGGACTTNNPEIAARIERLRSHGITRDPGEMENSSPGLYYYEQIELGFNYRITDIQCALGSSQLKRLDGFIEERNRLASVYSASLDESILSIPQVSPESKSSFHLYIVQVRRESATTRDRLFEKMRANGVLVNLHYIPIYRHPFYQKMDRYSPQDFPNSEHFYSTSLSIPIYPGLTRGEQSLVTSIFDGDLGFQTIF